MLITTATIVVEDAPIELQQLVAALQRQDAAKVQASAHALMGMLTTFEQSASVSGLQRIEQATINGDLVAAQSHLVKVRTQSKISSPRSMQLADRLSRSGG